MNPISAPRRYDLDWLRIVAFGLLIFYHIGMFYVTWDWHVKSPRVSTGLEPLMLALNPWRMDLLFLISGIASRFMLDRVSMAGFAGSRFHRLFWPLLFGMFVIVPPQAFYELMDAARLGQIAIFSESYLTFYGKYVSGYSGWCDAEGCLSVPTWNHLWFVAYLLIYSLGLALVWPVLKRLRLRLPEWTFFIGPWLVLWGFRATLFPIYGETHGLTDDIYLHAVYIFLFGLGVMIAKADTVFEAARQWRWLALFVAVMAYEVVLPFTLGWYPFEPSAWHYAVFRGVREAQAWFAIVALMGFAREHMSGHDGPMRRNLTEAVFPFYIIHQTIIVVAAWHLSKLDLPIVTEFGLLMAITIAGCATTYLIVRRIRVLRPLFGLKPGGGS